MDGGAAAASAVVCSVLDREFEATRAAVLDLFGSGGELHAFLKVETRSAAQALKPLRRSIDLEAILERVGAAVRSRLRGGDLASRRQAAAACAATAWCKAQAAALDSVHGEIASSRSVAAAQVTLAEERAGRVEAELGQLMLQQQTLLAELQRSEAGSPPGSPVMGLHLTSAAADAEQRNLVTQLRTQVARLTVRHAPSVLVCRIPRF